MLPPTDALLRQEPLTWRRQGGEGERQRDPDSQPEERRGLAGGPLWEGCGLPRSSEVFSFQPARLVLLLLLFLHFLTAQGDAGAKITLCLPEGEEVHHKPHLLPQAPGA